MAAQSARFCAGLLTLAGDRPVTRVVISRPTDLASQRVSNLDQPFLPFLRDHVLRRALVLFFAGPLS